MTPVCRRPWKTICGIRCARSSHLASRVGLRDRGTQPGVGRGLRERHQRPALPVPDVSVRRRPIAAAEPELGELVGERGRQRERLRLVALDDLPLDHTTPRLSPPEVPGDTHPAALEVEIRPLQREELALAEQQLERGADQRTPLQEPADASTSSISAMRRTRCAPSPCGVRARAGVYVASGE